MSFELLLKDEKKLRVYSERLFKCYDANRSNLFEQDEFYNLVIKIGKEQNVRNLPSKSEVQHLFNEFDKDRSGKLDEKEFLSFTKMILKEVIKMNEEKKK